VKQFIALFRVINRYVGNLPPMPGLFRDYPAPVIRNTEAGREMILMRWGMPPPPRTGGPPVTNIRNTSSPHWLCLSQIKSGHIGGVARRDLGGKECVRRDRRRARPVHLSPAIDACGPHCSISCNRAAGDGGVAR
jgi:hypothetical protein